jgi:hypothetical protein
LEEEAQRAASELLSHPAAGEQQLGYYFIQTQHACHCRAQIQPVPAADYYFTGEAMHLIQFNHVTLGCCLGVVRDAQVVNVTRCLPELRSVHRAFLQARRNRLRLDTLLAELLAGEATNERLDYRDLLASGQVLPPVGEEPGIRVLVSGTGLTHLGSAQQRDQMHQAPAPTPPHPNPSPPPGRGAGGEGAVPKTDSQRMFERGLEGGRPKLGERGVAPEWFYKGDGRILRGPGQALEIPPFAPDGGEEPELVGIYMVDGEGIPCRLGFCQGNEWSDHVTENLGYLYLAPAKLRTCAIGPELVTDLALDDIRGRCQVRRDGRVLYDSGELLTGERNMCHSLANLEDHHFKFPQHCQPGDVHVHFLGTSKLSFQHRQWAYQSGDVIEVAFAGLGAPLSNPVLRHAPSTTPIRVEVG